MADVHHVHAWSLTQKKPLVTLHARLEEPHGSQATLTAIKARLRERFGIGHATVEMEQDGCADGGTTAEGRHGPGTAPTRRSFSADASRGGRGAPCRPRGST